MGRVTRSSPAAGTPRDHGVTTPLEGIAARPWDADAVIEAPLRLHRCPVSPDWVDYNGHMSESCYLLVFGDNADAFFRLVGVDEAYREAGRSLYTAETHLHHRREATEGEPLAVSLQLLEHDDRRVHLFHEMVHGDSGAVVATAEQLLVHVDTGAGCSTPMPEVLRDRVAAVARAHAHLPRPAVVGRPMGIRRPGGTV